MKNIQVIDGADNATYSVFQATDDEFDVIFPDGQDIELSEDLVDRLGEERSSSLLSAVWKRPILKCDALGIHGTLFYDNAHRRKHIPVSKREIDIDNSALNEAQRKLFAQYR